MWIQSPHEMRHHPLFWVESRRVRWAHRVWPYLRRMVWIAHLTVFGAWSLLMAAVFVSVGGGLWVGQSSSGGRVWTGRLWDWNETSAAYFQILVVAIILAGVLLDYVCMQASARSFSSEIISRRWDLLRLTALNDWGIVRAKHAGVRLRVWRMTSLIASARIASISLGFFLILLAPYLFEGHNPGLANFLASIVEDPFTVGLVLLTAFITLLVYVIEVFWRVQAMSALGLLLSAHIMNTPLALLAGLGAILAIWMLQVLIVAALIFGLGFLGGGMLSPVFVFSGGSDWLFALYVCLCCAVTAATIYGFYNLLQSWSLRRVYYRIGRSD